MAPKCLIVAAPLLIGVAACDSSKITAPTVPLDLSVSVRTVDGARLPLLIPERPGAANYLTAYVVTLTAGGLWSAKGTSYPSTAPPTLQSEVWDNGYYQFDGTKLVLHSPNAHADWAGSVHGDTITSTMPLPMGQALHTVVMW